MKPERVSAFTLVELLVVITIIVVLLAMLTPALDKAIEQAIRAQCGANFHAWGTAHTQYYFDNKRKILAAPNLRKGIAQGLHPNHARYRHTTGPEAGDFNLDDIAPYVQGENDGPWNNATYLGDLWYCPNNKSNYFYENVHDIQAKDRQPDDPLTDQLSFMYMDYAYFGLAASKYPVQISNPRLLSKGGMGGGRILMSDTIFRFDPANVAWWFNHSDAGPSVHADFGAGDYVHRGRITGIGVNQLYADNSVQWKGEEQFDPNVLETMIGWEEAGINFVSSDASRPNPDVNSNLY